MRGSRYWSFLRRNPKLVGFGITMAFASSFGQTFFIGTFGPSIQNEFGLSHTEWGTVYLIGTLGSALVLPWTGKRIDSVALPSYMVAAVSLLAVACVTMFGLTGTVSLVLGIFLLRQGGQGLLSHIAMTSMARFFHAGRGKALALAGLGYALGEAVLPVVAVLMIGAIGWRWSYGLMSVALVLGILPLALWLLRSRPPSPEPAPPTGSAFDSTPAPAFTRVQVLSDRRFYLLLPGVLGPSMILTALFFHHLTVAGIKGWSEAAFTGSYIIYSLATVVASLVAGDIIDRVRAVRLLPWLQPPLLLGLMVLGYYQSFWAAWVYLALIGVNTGLVLTTLPAVWAELYGITHLGAIKSLVTSLRVLGSAVGPVAMGVMMDQGMEIRGVCIVFGLYTIIAGVMMALPPLKRVS